MALDEATSAFLAAIAVQRADPIYELTPDEARARGAMLRELYGPGPEVDSVTDEPIPLDAGGTIAARVFAVAQPRGVLVYFHGGGWVLGGLDDYDTLGRHLAAGTDCTVVIPEYRLAPEHRFPTAVNDAWAALKWVDARRKGLARADAPLIVAGDSAGGNLGAVVTQKAKVAGGPDVALQVLIYPATDCDLDTASYTDPGNQLMLSRASMAWFWDHYAPAERRLDPAASPLRAGDLTGLPPAVILTAEHDPLRDEGEAYADKLRAAGVEVVSRRFLGQMHGFFTLVDVLPGQRDGLDFVTAHVHRYLSEVQ